MFTLDAPKLLRVLGAIPDMQRKDWELNQSGAGRAMEAVLIQSAPCKASMFALVLLRFTAMPGLGMNGDAAS